MPASSAELERDLELERRKVRELQDGSRERDREYAKLKVSRLQNCPDQRQIKLTL